MPVGSLPRFHGHERGFCRDLNRGSSPVVLCVPLGAGTAHVVKFRTVWPSELPERVFSRDATRRLTRSIVLLPNGVVSWSLKVPGIVECSSNLGTVRPTEPTV